MPLGLIRVGANEKNPSHDIELWDGTRAIGLKLDGGPRGVQEIPQTPSTLKFSGGGTKFGDWEPGMSHIQQSDWSGGRGSESFSDDNARFFDSQSCWTMTPNKLMQGPRWTLSRGQLSVIGNRWDEGQELVGGAGLNFTFQSLTGSTRYCFTQISGYGGTMVEANLWIRRVGSPGTLTFQVRTNNAGEPSSTVTLSATATTSDITDFISVLYRFTFSGTVLANGTVYHLGVLGASTDNYANHWEVGLDSSQTGSTDASSDGTTWTTGPGQIFAQIHEAITTGKHHFFQLDGLPYCCLEFDSGASSSLWHMGDRGKATSATSTTLTDTNASFRTAGAVGLYTGATVKIINGTGVGQTRTISANTSTELTVSTWDITPDTTSEYIIYGTNHWRGVSSTGLGRVTNVCTNGKLPGIAYFAQGTTTIRRMRFNASASPPAHQFQDDGSNIADLLYTFYDEASKKSVVWRAKNSTAQISRANTKSWGEALEFGTGIPVGSAQYDITGLVDYDKKLWVAKEDSLWFVVDDTPRELSVGLKSSPNSSNGKAMNALGLFLYFNYMHSVEQLYGSTISDVGPWIGSGVPSGRTGVVSCMASAFNWLFIGIDAGTSGVSSVLLYDGRSYHEVFRGTRAGARIRNVYWFAGEGARPVLWIDYAGTTVAMFFPMNTLNPLNDSTFDYHHEGVLIGSTIDMDAFNLPKFIKELTLITENLSQGTEVRVDYQTDNNIGTSTWTPLGTFYQSPVDVVTAGFGNIRQIRFRYRLITDSSTTPTIVKASVMEGYARTPLKYQWNMRVKTSDFQVNYLGARDASPDDVSQFLKDAARGARKIIMRSRFKGMDNIMVIVEPPSILREFANSILQFWGGTMTVVVREA